MKKDFLNLRRSRWLLLSLFALFVGVSPAWADAYTCGFESSDGWAHERNASTWIYTITSCQEGWGLIADGKNLQISSATKHGGDYSLYTSTSNTVGYVVSPRLAAGTISFYGKRNDGSGYISIYKVEEKDGSFELSASPIANFTKTQMTSTSSWFKLNCELDEDSRIAILLNYAYIDDFSASNGLASDTPVEGPMLSVYNGSTKVTSGFSHNFGLSTAGTEKIFTLKNPGTESITLNIAGTNGFGVSPANVTISAGGEETLTVTMADATASGVVTITPTVDGVDAFTINVSGTVRDPNRVFETLLEGSIPEDWTTSGNWYWSATNGAYNTTYYESNNYRLITPLLTVAEGETFFFEAKGTYSGYQGVKFEYSTDGVTWTPSSTTTTVSGEWQSFAINDVPAGNYYIALHGWQVNIRNFYGGKLPDGAKFAINTDGTTQSFGALVKDATATKPYTITNNGNAALNVTFAPSEGFSTVPSSLNVAAGASETFNVVMNTATTGVKSGNVVLSFDALNATSFTIPVSGVVLPAGTIVVDFNDNQLPEGWTNEATNKWNFGDGKAYTTAQSSNPAELVTKKLTFADNDFFVISATSYDNYDNNYIEILGSTDEGTTWTAFDAKKFISRSQIPYGSYAMINVSGIPSNVNKIKIRGYYVRIDEIVGLTYDANAPVLTVDPTTAADFGTKIKAQPAAKTYTITNSGTGTLTGSIESSDTDKFTVSESSFSLGAGASMTFEVNLVFDANYGAKAATITVHPTNDGLGDVVINATATTADPNIWEEDFEGGSVPEGWIANDWTVTKSNYNNNGTFMFAAGTSNTKTAYSPRLYAEKDQVLSFYVGGADATDFQTVKWSHDRNAAAGDWTLIGEFTSAGPQEFTAPETGYYYLSFQGKYTSVDNFYGFKLSPLEHDAYISAQNIPATGTQYVKYTATVTVKEMAGKAEDMTAKFFIGGVQYGANVVETVDANGTNTFTVTFTPDAAVSGNAHFTVTNGDINLTSDNVAVNISEALVLDEAVDNSAKVVNWNVEPVVVVKYTKAAKKWGTIALPFATTAAELTSLYGPVKAFGFTAKEGGNLKFEPVTDLSAGEPYVIYSDAAMGGDVKFFGKTMRTANYNTHGDVTFHAIYDPKTYTAGDSWYGITPDGEICPAGTGASVNALRGYLQAAAGARLVISIEDVATGITTVLSSKEFEAEGVYNLQGQKVQQAKKGLYIVNGRKVVVR